MMTQHRQTENEARVLLWTRFEAESKLIGAGLRFPIPAEAAWPVQAFDWQGLYCSVACQVPFDLLSVDRLTFSQNASKWFESISTYYETS